ncbi:MAG TPA: manganese ABC transporter ATP-binding protein, partial [Planctomycetaceae bacterium]|nr:manganese ABC transporter ATP-binding protein [Planctomycetaceae bacterium]
MSSIALEIHDMTVAYHRRPVLWDIDMQIPEGKLVGIVGPNGAGKTTLIKAALGLVPLASGKVEIYGKSYQQQRHLVGYVPQRESVDWDFPVTVRDVVLMGTYGHLGWFKRPGKKQYEIADRCLQQVGISQLSNRQIRQLSGGQQQRVFLARALAQNAQLYFLDEPFAGVDPMAVVDIQNLIQKLRMDGMGILITDHNVRET